MFSDKPELELVGTDELPAGGKHNDANGSSLVDDSF